ncbi:MAG: 50S ribosomal protein L10 [Holophagaceae bacterium]|jgi:large subunit ribosomal protein L10
MMEKNKKVTELTALKQTFTGAKSAIVFEFKGLTVETDTAFRKSVRDHKGQYRVGKNTLLRLAVKDTVFESLSPHFKGASSVATTQEDMVAFAKVLNDFLKDNPAVTFKAGLSDGKPLALKDIQQLANLPSREVLIAKLLYLIKSPISGLAITLDAIRKQKESQ